MVVTPTEIALAAPLVVINIAAVLTILFVSHPLALDIGGLVLFLNTGSSYKDIYNIAHVADYPLKTLFVNKEENGETRTFTYLPTA